MMWHFYLAPSMKQYSSTNNRSIKAWKCHDNTGDDEMIHKKACNHAGFFNVDYIQEYINKIIE